MDVEGSWNRRVASLPTPGLLAPRSLGSEGPPERELAELLEGDSAGNDATRDACDDHTCDACSQVQSHLPPRVAREDDDSIRIGEK